MKFGEAVDLTKKGAKITREGWNGSGMFLMLVNPEEYSLKVSIIKNQIVPLTPWLGIKTAQGYFGPWLASQADILATDWYEVNV